MMQGVKCTYHQWALLMGSPESRSTIKLSRLPSEDSAGEDKLYVDSDGHRSHIGWGDMWGTAGSHLPGTPLGFMHREYDVYEAADQLDVALLSDMASINLDRLFAASGGSTIPSWLRFQQVHRLLVWRVPCLSDGPSAAEEPQGSESQGSDEEAPDDEAAAIEASAIDDTEVWMPRRGYINVAGVLMLMRIVPYVVRGHGYLYHLYMCQG